LSSPLGEWHTNEQAHAAVAWGGLRSEVSEANETKQATPSH